MIYTNIKTKTSYLDISDFPFGKNGMQFPVVSLFTGAGGLDIGLEEAGFHTAVCVEYDTDCRETLRFNRPEWKLFEEGIKIEPGKLRTRIPGDIRDVGVEELLRFAGLKKGKVSLVVGGAPCQPFSNIGKKQGKNDQKNGDLFLEFVRMVKGIQPEAFIFENVVGITQQKHSDVISYMIDKFKGLGYGISHTVLNAANFGVPQRRERFFLIGIKGIERPAFPFPTHFKDEKHYETFIKDLNVFPVRNFKKWVSVKTAFKRIPKNPERRNDFALMNISDVVVNRMTYIKQGQNFKVLPMSLRPDCWKSGKHQGNDTFGRIIADLPSVTIRTAAYNPAKGMYIHPFENRGLSTIEMAALQSFPISWQFKCKGREKITLVSGGKQIGNAVPPGLAQVLGAAIKRQILSKRSKSVQKQFELVRVN
ncbi:MAG TPA: DNA cytosine methyltransferase [Cytophagaceae bacterium]|jgi:DNA (cytosine-5)-methyltransferase 1|nr:DNA cytosine methyltransferase [Cytophagaceae bacterium]